jgi:type IV pilus assembly protein PilE
MKKAFTLLEMLIVLGIIAIILSVLSVSFAATQKKSRDAKRKGDLKALQSGLEQYYATCGSVYPTGIPNIACGGSPAIISIAPVDPKTASPYPYSPTGISPNIDGFAVCTTLESESPASYCLYSQQ